jgi:ParB-like chromosome segregation protein Spo0J
VAKAKESSPPPASKTQEQTTEVQPRKEEEPEIPAIEQALKEGRYDQEFPYVPLSAMNPAPYNPRNMSPQALEALSNSLENYGLVQPLIWNKRSGNLVGGHQRFKILKQRGVKEVKTCIVDLDEVDEKALNITLNNPEVQGTFDTSTLKKLIASIKSKKTKAQFKNSGLEALENQQELFEGGVKKAKEEEAKTAQTSNEPPVDLSYIAPPLRGLAVPINSLKPDPNNVRTHDDKNRLAVRNSLSKFGQLRPIVIHKKMVMAGNCTWEEMKALGLTHIAAVVADHLSIEEMVAFGIVDNKSAQLAGTDFKKLGDVFRTMEEQWLPLTGFSEHEIQPLLAAEWKPPAPNENADNDPQSQIPETQGQARARQFDLTEEATEMLKRTIEFIGAESASEGVMILCEHYVKCIRQQLRSGSSVQSDAPVGSGDPS